MIKKGILRELSTGSFRFFSDDGKTVEIDDVNNAPVEIFIEIQLENKSIRTWKRDSSKLLAHRNQTIKDIALILLIEPEQETHRTQYQTIISKSAKLLQDNLKWIGKGLWKVSVTPYVLSVPDKSIYGINGDWSDLIKRLNDYANKNNHNYWHISGVPSLPGSSGVAFVNGIYAVTENPSNFETMIHEQGHNFGLGHHSSSSSEYGGYSWMGRGWSYNAPNLHYLGLIEQENIGSDKKNYFLVRPETDPIAMHTDEDKLVYLDINENRYALSYFNNRIRIDTVKPGYPSDPPWQGVEFVTELNVGDTWNNVSFTDTNSGVAQITIDNYPPIKYPGIMLPDIVEETQNGKTGVWHHPSYTHQGFDIHVLDVDNGLRVIAYWYTWGKGPRWFLLDGIVEDNIAKMKIYSPRYGDKDKNLDIIGDAWLYFYDDMTGMIKYWIDADEYLKGKGAIQLERLTRPKQDEVYGVYDFEEKKHEGMSISIDIDTGSTVGYWYGYTNDRTYRPQWLMIYTDKDEKLRLYKPHGGMINVSNDSYLEDVGECIFNKDTFIYKNKTINLIRLI